MDKMEGEKALNTSTGEIPYNTEWKKSKARRTAAAQKKLQAKSRKQFVNTRPCCTFKYA